MPSFRHGVFIIVPDQDGPETVKATCCPTSVKEMRRNSSLATVGHFLGIEDHLFLAAELLLHLADD